MPTLTSKQVCLIDDDRGPIDLYVRALREALGEDQVERIMTVPDALKHFDLIKAGQVAPARLYIIDIMMPPVEPQWFEVTNEGLTSGIFLLGRLREAEQVSGAAAPAHVLMMTAVSNPDILARIGASKEVDVLAKLEWNPTNLALEAVKILQPATT